MAESIQDLIKNIKVGEETVFSIAGAEGDRKLTVSQRKLLPEEPRAPIRAESMAKAHTFFAAESLGKYLAKYGGAKTVVFADPNAEIMYATLAEDATTGFETVTMKPAPHPLWKPWADLAGKKIGVKEFAAFIQANRRAVIEPDGRDLAFVCSQIRASVSIERQQGRGKEAINGLTIKTKIQGQEIGDILEIPETIKIRVPLYVGTSPRDLELDLLVEADEDAEVTVLVSAGTILDVRVQAFAEMCGQVDSWIGTSGATLTYGVPKTLAWTYLREQQW